MSNQIESLIAELRVAHATVVSERDQLRKEVEDLQSKLASFQWKPVSEGTPKKGEVYIAASEEQGLARCSLEFGGSIPPWAAHYFTIPPLPPVPAETEDEQKMRREFEAWWEFQSPYGTEKDVKGDYCTSSTIAAWIAWKAAHASRNKD